ncbi:MAG: O-antigen ligase family protein [Acidobacteriota bacterium]|nr:O-antigen ligase family protein [Acidobacteriota bacterium]
MSALHKISRFSPFWLASVWSVILLAGFLPSIPQPAAVIGYLWKVEFVLATFILLTFVLALKFPKDKINLRKFDSREITRIILPLIFFTAWSGFSCIWAESSRNAVHHMLLWACYVLFYLLIRQISFSRKLLNVSFTTTGVVVSILGSLCLIEYFTTATEFSADVSVRYSKYAEAIAALLPVFIFLAIEKKRRNSILFGAVAIIGWLGIIFSLSRTQFLAGTIGVLIFAACIVLFGRQKISLKKAVIFAGLFICVTACSQVSVLTGNNSQQTTLNRFSNDERSQTSFALRFVFWNIALQSFEKNPILGVGGDNYVCDYDTARMAFAEKEPDNLQAAIYEDILPERAHNEFLQILSELGAVGALLFAWLLLGIAKCFLSARKKDISLLTLASLAGICAFFVSSTASSYSFRVPASGVCFFFLLALAVRGLLKAENEVEVIAEKNVGFDFLGIKPTFVAIGLIICAATLIFSAVRGVSLMYLQMALNDSDKSEIEADYQKAIALDEREGLFKYYYAMELYNDGRAAEAVPQMRFAIDRGISTSIAYFYLASAQINAKQMDEAEKTLTESIRLYPRSVFLRTFYAWLLKEEGKDAESTAEYEKSFEINPDQTKSWWLAQTEGTKKLNQKQTSGENYIRVMWLKPDMGVYALLDFQRQNNPKLLDR